MLDKMCIDVLKTGVTLKVFNFISGEIIVIINYILREVIIYFVKLVGFQTESK